MHNSIVILIAPVLFRHIYWQVFTSRETLTGKEYNGEEKKEKKNWFDQYICCDPNKELEIKCARRDATHTRI